MKRAFEPSWRIPSNRLSWQIALVQSDLPRRHREALRRKVDDVVGPRLLEKRAHREEIAQVGLDQGDPVAQVLDVLRLAPPAERADHLGALRERVLGEVAADETGDASDQNAHVAHTTTVDAALQPTAIPAAARAARRRGAPARAPGARRRPRTTRGTRRSAPPASARASRCGAARRRAPP